MNKNLMIRTLTVSALLVASAGAAFAGHGRPRDARVRLIDTAYELEVRTANLERFADRFASPWDLRERVLMRDLGRLADEAQAFRALVEGRSLAPVRLDRALDDVLRAYDRSANSLARVRMPRAVYGRFDRLGDLIDETQRATFRFAAIRRAPRPIPHEFRVYAVHADRDDDDRDRVRDAVGRTARPIAGDDDDQGSTVRNRPRRLND